MPQMSLQTSTRAAEQLRGSKAALQGRPLYRGQILCLPNGESVPALTLPLCLWILNKHHGSCAEMFACRPAVGCAAEHVREGTCTFCKPQVKLSILNLREN